MNTSNLTPSTLHNDIVGVTGLSRGVLAGLFRRDGLFGHDSELSAVEQAVVGNALPAIRGVKRPLPVVLATPKLAALADYALALVAGRSAIGERARAEAAGLSAAAANEVETVIGNAYTVFGLTVAATPRAAQPVTAQPLPKAA